MCTKKACGGFITLEWNPDMIKKDGLFVIGGECEICHRKYAVAMQLFEKSKLKKGSRIFEQLQIIETCSQCMVCCGSTTSKMFFCDDAQKWFKDSSKIQKWCPLKRLIR